MNRTLALKLFVIGVVTGVILIALGMVNGTINDRKKYRDDAVKSIEASYAGPQTVIGPVLIRPYTQTTVTMEEEKGTRKKVEHVTAMTATSFSPCAGCARKADADGAATWPVYSDGV